MLPRDEVDGRGGEVVVAGLHSLCGQGSGVFYFLFAHPAPARLHRGIILLGREAMQDAARPELCLESRVLRIIGVLRVLFRVQVVQVAIEFIEAMDGWQPFVLVAQVILAELAGRIA
jgi:hypothetical protein